MTRSLRPLFLVAPVVLLIAVFLLLPYLNIVGMSFRAPATSAPYGEGFTAASYQKVFSDPYYLRALFMTLWLGALTTTVCLILGFPVALHLARAGSRWRGLLYGVVLSPLLIGIVVRSYGWTILLGNNGAVNRALRSWGLIAAPLPLMYNSFGVVVALAHVFLPFMILPILSALQGIDPALEGAARSLGATRAAVFRRIILPLAAPGVQSGVILVFVLAVSAYVTPMLVGGMRVKTLAVVIVDTLLDQFQWPLGSALALTLSVATAALALVFVSLTRIRWK